MRGCSGFHTFKMFLMDNLSLQCQDIMCFKWLSHGFPPKMLMDIYVRDIHNAMIKPSDNGVLEIVVDSETQKVLISDTTLRLFIPTQVCKMTPRLRQIYRYELFMIPKDMQIYLNRPRTNLVSDIHQKSVGRHKHNIAFSTTSTVHYKYKVFPDGECWHATIKYAYQFISCTHIKPKNTMNIKCDFFVMSVLST